MFKDTREAAQKIRSTRGKCLCNILHMYVKKVLDIAAILCYAVIKAGIKERKGTIEMERDQRSKGSRNE
jgi:hypothetical protein